MEKLINKNFEDLPSTLFVTDGEGNILISNEFTALTIGMPLEDLLKCNVQDLVAHGYYSHSIAMEAIKRKERVTSMINTNRGFHIKSTAIPILNNRGEVQLVVTKSNQYKEKLETKEEAYQLLHPHDSKTEEMANIEEGIVAESVAMKQIIKVCNQIAPYDTKVLIYGESGTGKEVIARYIHRKSGRSSGPFVSVNCAAIQPSLFELELFGYEKGAFEGATDSKQGIIEAANGGTLFLDEIAELPLEMQAKLLRVIENNEVRRVGGVQNLQVDCRMIAATNQELWKMVKKGMFREDLYYRINVIPIDIPPLRNRKSDLVGLISAFIAEFNKKYNKQFTLHADDFQKMLWQDWRGNARELRNYLERLVITEQSLLLDSNEAIVDSFTLDYFIKNNMERYTKLKDFTTVVEGRYIQLVLDACGGIATEAAKRLGIDRSVIYRKLKRLDEVTKEDG